MIKRDEPWRNLPAALADVIEPQLPGVTEEILATIAREVPDYARPLEGAFGRGLRTGVTEALRQFIHLIRDPDAGRGTGRDVYVALGRGELRVGRTLDALQAAYRVGARVAWRRVSALARDAGFDAEVLSLLAEAIFAYIDEISADSVDGYAQAQSEREGERQRRRRELVALLLADEPPAGTDLAAAAQAAGWTVPRRAAAVACAEEDLARLIRRLPVDAAGAPLLHVGCVVVPDPDGPGRRRELVAAARGLTVGLGPTGTIAELGGSWSIARIALSAGDADGLIVGDDHLGDLLLHASSGVAEQLAARRLAPLDELTAAGRRRLEKTALAYVQQGGNAVAMARVMNVHPQTARYRLARLQETLGDRLDSPDGRFELEIALRARGVRLP